MTKLLHIFELLLDHVDEVPQEVSNLALIFVLAIAIAIAK